MEFRKMVMITLYAKQKEAPSILKEINPKYSLEELMLKLKFQYLATGFKEPVPWKRL